MVALNSAILHSYKFRNLSVWDCRHGILNFNCPTNFCAVLVFDVRIVCRIKKILFNTKCYNVMQIVHFRIITTGIETQTTNRILNIIATKGMTNYFILKLSCLLPEKDNVNFF